MARCIRERINILPQFCWPNDEMGCDQISKVLFCCGRCCCCCHFFFFYFLLFVHTFSHIIANATSLANGRLLIRKHFFFSACFYFCVLHFISSPFLHVTVFLYHFLSLSIRYGIICSVVFLLFFFSFAGQTSNWWIDCGSSHVHRSHIIMSVFTNQNRKKDI